MRRSFSLSGLPEYLLAARDRLVSDTSGTLVPRSALDRALEMDRETALEQLARVVEIREKAEALREAIAEVEAVLSSPLVSDKWSWIREHGGAEGNQMLDEILSAYVFVDGQHRVHFHDGPAEHPLAGKGDLAGRFSVRFDPHAS